jgi:hypothetical protein
MLILKKANVVNIFVWISFIMESSAINKRKLDDSTVAIDDDRNVRARSDSNPIRDLGNSLFVIANSRRRFFLPTKENYFGGYRVEYVMIDTGCNTSLLPIHNVGVFKQLIERFPVKEYKWTIQGSSGVAAIPSPVLTVEPRLEGGRIDVNISQGEGKYECKLESIRFHLCLEDARYLLKDEHSILEHVVNVEKLNIFVANMGIAKGMKRRTHALLGQSIIGKRCYAQCGNVGIMSETIDDMIYSLKVVDRIESYGNSLVERHFQDGGKEFQDLEDEDHDDDVAININMFAID